MKRWNPESKPTATGRQHHAIKPTKCQALFANSFDTWAKRTNIRLMLSVAMKSKKKISQLARARTTSHRDDVVFRLRNSGKQQTYVGYS